VTDSSRDHTAGPPAARPAPDPAAPTAPLRASAAVPGPAKFPSSTSEPACLPLGAESSDLEFQIPASAPAPAHALPVAVIEDDDSYRRALQRLLGPRCVGAWPHVTAALAGLPGLSPAVLLVDIDLPDVPGHVAVPALLAAAPSAQALMLTAHDDADLIFRALQAGAVGYLLKTAAPEDIVAAIAAAAGGGSPFSPAIARRVVGFFAACAVPPPSPAPARDLAVAALTDRERALLELVAAGATDKQVADRLGLSHGSVRNRLHAIYRKLHVTSRTAAALRWRSA